LADNRNNKEQVIDPTEKTNVIEPPKELPFSRLNFFGILISGLIILVSIGYFVISIIFHYDKRGKEIYYTDNPDIERDLAYVFRNLPTDGASARTDYWGWFKRSHDENYMLNDYDVYYWTFILGITGGIYWTVLGISEIIKYNNNSLSKGICVSYFKS
jgi:hypothetical protein